MNVFTICFSADSTMSFTKISTIVCIFVIVREFRPVEPFLAVYLTSPPINLTEKQVSCKMFGFYKLLIFISFRLKRTGIPKYKCESIRSRYPVFKTCSWLVMKIFVSMNLCLSSLNSLSGNV